MSPSRAPAPGPLLVVTGASSGIGAALVRGVPWADAEVLGISRRPPVGARHLFADLADPASWSEVARALVPVLDRHEGQRVVVVHAAGTLEPVGFAAEVDPEAYQRAVLLGASTLALGQRLVHLLAPRSGRRQLVLLTSGAARTVYPGWSAYGAAKAAMDQWCRTVGAEQTQRGGVQVLSVAPGTVDTPMQELARGAAAEDFPVRERFAQLHRTGKLAAPDEVARRIFELLDEDLPSGSVLDLREHRSPGPDTSTGPEVSTGPDVGELGTGARR